MFYQPLLIGNEPYSAELVAFSPFGAHWHNEIEIIRCLFGSFKAKIDGCEYTVARGEIIFVASVESHEYYNCEPGTKIQYVELGSMFLGNDFSIISELGFTKPIISSDKNSDLYCEVSPQIYSIMRRLEAECENRSLAHNWIVKSCLYDIATLILRLPSKKEVSKARKNRMKAISDMQPAIDYISENYHHAITVDEISRYTGYGKSNFCKRFKIATQMSFHKYLNICRIGKACVLLADKNIPVGKIGEQLGFTETKTFCRVFKQIMNMTPTEYRETL